MGTGAFLFDCLQASTDGAPDPLCDSFALQDIDNDVWFAWTPGANGDYSIDTCAMTVVDTKMALYDGTACPTASPLFCNDDACGLQSQILANGLIGGQTYLLRVGTFPGTFGGNGFMNIQTIMAPANDNYPDTGGNRDQRSGHVPL